MAGGVVRKRKFLLTRASTLFCPAALPTEAAASTSLLHLVEGDAANGWRFLIKRRQNCCLVRMWGMYRENQVARVRYSRFYTVSVEGCWGG